MIEVEHVINFQRSYRPKVQSELHPGIAIMGCEFYPIAFATWVPRFYHRHSELIVKYNIGSVGNKVRKLNKICSGNLYPFSTGVNREHILTSRQGDKVSIFSQNFQDLY